MSSTTSPGTPRDTTSGTASRSAASRVVSDLVSAGLVHPDRSTEAESVVSRSLAAKSQGGSTSAGSRLAEVAGYVGGALVVAAVGLVLGTSWSALSEAAQVGTLAVITVLLAGAGLVVGKVGGGYAELRDGRDDSRRRLTSALLTAAALAGALTVARVVEVAGDEFSAWPGFAGGATMLVLSVLGYRIAPSALGQLALAAAGLTTIFTGLSVLGDTGSTLVPGLVVLGFAAAWLLLAELPVFREPVVARFLGVGMALVGAQLPIFDHANLAYALTLAVAVAGFVLYLRTTSWPYLVAGVLGITLVVPEAVVDWTEGSLGTAGAVLVAGLTLIGASLAGLRVRQEATD